MVGMPEFLPFVRRWFAETFADATRPQREGWEAIASGRDTLIVAPTGSGKTLAAFLWALDHLHRLGLERRLEDRVYVVYVSPLRALNNDIEKNLREPLAGIRAAAAADGLDLPEVRVAVRTGDTLAAARQAMTRRPPHVLITTPESLYILLTTQRLPRQRWLRRRFVIVDEVHALMASKRGAHLALSLERLQALVEGDGTVPARSGSAARPPCARWKTRWPSSRAPPPAIPCWSTPASRATSTCRSSRRSTTSSTTTSDTVWDAALQQIAELVQAHRTTLVFAQSRRAAERLARDLNDRLVADGRVAAHHGSLSRRARLEAENRLKAGELRALVATSSLELGIDVGAIDLVVQVQSPRNVAAALQRVGRAGHLLSRTSKGRILVTKGEELMEAAAVVRAIRERSLDRIAMPEAPLDVLAQQIVAAVAAESLDVDTLHRRFVNAAPYRALSRATFLEVVRAVAEPLPLEVKGIAPRILWDRVNDRLHARRGTPLPGADRRRHHPRRRAARRLRGRDGPEGGHPRRGVRHRKPARRRVPARLPRLEDRQGQGRPRPRRGRPGHGADHPVLEGRAPVALVRSRRGGRSPAPRRCRQARRRPTSRHGRPPRPASTLARFARCTPGWSRPARCCRACPTTRASSWSRSPTRWVAGTP